MPWRPLIVGVDASAAGIAAAHSGWELARAMETSCILVHAARDVAMAPRAATGVDVGALSADVLRLARREIEGALAHRGVPAELLSGLEVRLGKAGTVLGQAAAAHGADLVVLGAKRHHLVARWLGGSTAKSAVRALDVSVLVTTGPGRWSRIVAAVDLSEMALPTVHAAERVAGLVGAKLRVLHAIEPFPYSIEGIPPVDVEALAREQEVTFRETIWSRVSYGTAEPVVRRGGAGQVIEDEAAEWKADLVVVGAHGRGPMERFLLGSVSEGVVNALPTSVLVVRGAGPGAS